jgi:hypothetical protein
MSAVSPVSSLPAAIRGSAAHLEICHAEDFGGATQLIGDHAVEVDPAMGRWREGAR